MKQGYNISNATNLALKHSQNNIITIGIGICISFGVFHYLYNALTIKCI
jgi:hypothetical protein